MQALYFMGMGGTAMGNAALLFSQMGYTVSGVDGALYPPMSTLLETAGITCFQGYDAQRLAQLKPDWVVVGNIISRGNPEMEWLLNTQAFPYLSLPELLRQRVLSGRKNIVITGTHGKTTTTTLAAYLLKNNGMSPGYFIGGVPKDFPSGAALGDPDVPFVIEGDEYDTAFFDKRSKFIHYAPFIGVINNIEFDHADIFRDLQDVQRTFQHFTRLIPQKGYLLVNGDDSSIRPLLSLGWTTVLRVGLGPENDLQIRNFSDSPAGLSSFDLIYQGQHWERIESSLPGVFNARNLAMAALAAGLSLNGDPTQLSLASLRHFQGVKRRQDILMDSGYYTLIEDFGHHPSAVEQTLKSLRTRYPDHRLSVCFEPSSNTSQSSVFQEAFVNALSLAHQVFLAPPPKKQSLGSLKGLDVPLLVQSLESLGLLAHAFLSVDSLFESLRSFLLEQTTKPHLVCFFSNGSFGDLPQRLKEALLALEN